MAEFARTMVSSGSDANLHRTIRLKRLVSSSARTIISEKENTKMFEQFYIFGAPPDSSFPLRPTLLTTYPSTSHGPAQSNEVIEQLKMFCFPSGFKSIKSQNHSHNLNLNSNSRYNSNNSTTDKEDEKVLLNEFVFYMSSSCTNKTYGICVQFRVTNSKSAYFATHYSRKYPFCLCFLSKTPFLSSHFQFASYLALILCGIEKPTRAHVNEKRAPLPIKGFCHESLQLDKNFPAIAVFKGFSVPRIIFDELTFFHSIKVSTDDISSSIEPIVLSNDMLLCIPFHFSSTKCLAYPTFHSFFSVLTPAQIVQIYTAILLEQRILFISNDLQLASFSVIASTSLISPFVTQASVMPIIPSNDAFQEILQSPIPYIAGSTKSHENADVIINLDDGTINMKSPLPALPKANDLIHKLELLMNASERSILVPSKEIKSFFGHVSKNPEYDKFMDSINVYVFPKVFTKYSPVKYIFTPFLIEDILLLFSGILAPKLTDLLSSCFVTDTTDESSPITIMNRELLLCLVPQNEVKFYSMFTATQIFNDFCEKKTDEYSNSLIKPSLIQMCHSVSLPNLSKHGA
ncbi:hypothetical protein TRFO_41804 [Tritrichomonas foetus]|uniref:UDENN domain-containing protein n=1 Tax=Tritrichomonas foetus TaxID=1144522 RepID=A0A1J4L041_9EUKA|nr:hypothetical protein TRFO_41804 [Tritrichomonas foetus]|eukprot:OHT16496.1 hypothetical protein TRFO_41804 [Tritrichomonas foetus]